MKTLFRWVGPLAPKHRALLLGGVLGFCALSSSGVGPREAGPYTIEYGVGTAPYDYRTPTANYQIEATGVQNHQEIHGFTVHHDGTDTHVDLPVENYYIAGLQVNELGQVSGTYNANFGGFGCHSFFWEQGQLIDFPYPGKSDPHVHDMNNLGEVVGTYMNIGSRAGFIWDHGNYLTFDIGEYLRHFQFNGQQYDLTHGEATQLTAVNDSGQLLGAFGPSNGGPSFWFIATPVSVPEPGALSLLGLGLSALVGFRRKPKQQ